MHSGCDIVRILITGGTSGIGKSLVELLSSNNEVIFTYKNNIKEKEILEKKYLVNGYYLDLESKDSINKLVNNINNIDVLINNAACALDNDFNLKSYEEFKKVIDTNLTGTYYLTKLLSKKINNNGSIIFITSTNGINTEYIESIDYDASKAGVISLMRNFANYLAPNIRVNAIAPGWVDTPMNENISDDFRKKEVEKILLGRFAKPIEIANVIIFLISKEASYINKTIIRVDGGLK